MIKSITITNYLGESITLELRNPEASGLAVKSITGLGPVKANINTVEVSTNDGAIYNSARLESRNIVLNLAFLWSPTIEDVRQKTYKYFPIKKSLRFAIETDNRKVYATGYTESNEPTLFSDSEGATISIICPDPYFYSFKNGGTKTTTFGGITPMFVFPFSNKSLTEKLLVMGEITTTPTAVITYDGDAEVGVNIVIDAYGPATNIVVYNMETQETMRIDTSKIEALTGENIKNGDTIYICTIKGEKSITLLRSGVSTNILNCLDKNVSWLQLSKGSNVFAYSADSGMINLRVRIENQIVYEGV